MTNSAYAPTVHWLPVLDPTLAGRDAALNTYQQQVSDEMPVFFCNESIGVWGWIGPSAALLFAFPQDAGRR